MTPPIDTCISDNSNKNNDLDEPFETPEFMTQWTDKQKADFAFQLLTTLPPYHVTQIFDRISPYLYRNILSQFPYEIAIYILSFLDMPSLIQASQVSKGWHALCEEQSLWRNLFERQGWEYDREEINAYLINAPEEEDYNAGSSGNGALSGNGSGSGGNASSSSNSNSNSSSNSNNNKALSPVPIVRTSSSLISKSKWSKLYNIRSNNNNSNNNHTPPKRPITIKRHDELFDYHFDPISDTRFINWQRLYQNRFAIDNRWMTGSCKIRLFPTAASDIHAEGIYSIQFDKEKMVTGSRDHTVKVWDMTTGKCKQTISGHLGSVLCLQYDDQYIVSGSSDASLMVSDIETGLLKKRLKGHHDSVLSLRLVGQDQVVSCSKDRSVRLWNKHTGECIHVMNGHRAAVNAVQWKDNRIVSASGDRTIRIWELDTGKCLKTLTAHTRGVACVEFDGTRIVSGSSDQTIKVWNAITGDCIYTLVGHTDLVRTIQLDTVARRIISGCYKGQLKIWDLKEGRLIRDLGQATEGRILNLKFNFAQIACCSNNERVSIYDFAHDINTKFLM